MPQISSLKAPHPVRLSRTGKRWPLEGAKKKKQEKAFFERAIHSVPTRRLIPLQEVLLSANKHKTRLSSLVV